MEIKLIEFEFGMTQNLGDYTNTRPSVKLVAELSEGEDLDMVLESLKVRAVTAVHEIVDDELEAARLRVKYYDGPLFRVDYSDKRQCILISPADTNLPDESNWRDKDHWHRASHDHPADMRREAALAAANQRFIKTGYMIYQSVDDIPPLPDPGPEPAWHAKDLQQPFRRLYITDETLLLELGELEHVTADYLRQLYNKNAELKLKTDELVALIRTGQPFAVAEPEEEEDEYDEDDEDEEDTPF